MSRSLGELLVEGIFLITHPFSYWRIARARGRRSDEMRALRRTTCTLESLLARNRIRGQVSGRLKLVSSIHRKMVCRGLPQEAILDTRGLRIIVAGERTCYRVLTMVHRHFEPILGQLDDYIASPKHNGYQSLHTVVRDNSGRSYEIQIRTSLMHRNAVRGSAAHRRYKERSPAAQVVDTFR
jgi:GTP pyrophosphokinase